MAGRNDTQPLPSPEAPGKRGSSAAPMGTAALLAAALVLPMDAAAQPSPVAGEWGGSLQVGGQSLPLVFRIVEGEDGSLTGTMDSPAQGATGIPVESTTLEGDRLVMELPPLAARFEGTLVEPDRIEGEWTQGGASLPLQLRRDAAPARPSRPQDPVPPLPYRVEDVTYPNQEAGIELAGTFTIPRGEGPFPAVALITGSGPQDRDESLMGHRPFLVLSDHLTRQGIAVLRSDDRGVGGSGGDFSTATTRDFAADAAAAVAWLRARPEVDGGAVGLVGHSEGGIVAPMVAVERGGVDFVVLLAGPGLPGEEILYLQGAAVSRAMGAPEPAVERTLELQRRLFGVVRSVEDQTQRTASLREELQSILDETPAAERPGLGIPPGQEENWIQGQVMSLSTPWFRYFLLHDPADDLRNLQIPVLALLGGKDLQVPPGENAAAIRAALESGGNPDPTVEVLDGLNHLFQQAETGSPMEYGQIEETFAPAALERVSDWILERAGRTGGGGN
jgi:uncharacterized protein